MQKKLVLFDIDGTLLYSKSSVLRSRFEYAMEKVYGTSHPVDWKEIEGHTDTTVFFSSLKKRGLTEEQIREKLPQAFEVIYEHFVTNVTDEYKNALLPGARSLLEHFKQHVHIGILTGNYEKIAWHKLQLVGLRDLFEFGIFGHEADDRPGLARLIQKKAKHHFSIDFNPEDIYLIGDTPKDILCAREIGARVISVPTGKYTKTELQDCSPDLLVDSLENPEIIKFILGNHAKVS